MNNVIKHSFIECSVCGSQNPDNSIFCTKCISPLNVKKLDEMVVDDFLTAAKGLLQSLSSPVPTSVLPTKADKELLSSYLSAFWLRPETALYQAAEASIVVPLIAEHANEPFLDLGCGNGVNTSLIAGWRFSQTFDVFDDLDLEADDIYNNPLNKLKAVEKIKQGRIIDFGIDIKENMIQRASKLETFDKTLNAEAADMPIEDSSIGVIYSNVLRDFDGDGLQGALSECARILKPGGSLIFSTPTEAYRDKLYYYPLAKELEKNGSIDEAQHLLSLDRGRSVYCTQQITISDWEQHLTEHGLQIKATYPVAGQQLMHFWDTGLRPYTPLLMRLFADVSDSRRQELKVALIEFFIDYLAKILVNDRNINDSAFRVIHVRKI